MVGVTFSHVCPPMLEEMHEDRVAPNVHIGIHAQEVRGVANARSRRGGVAEEGRTVRICVRIEASAVKTCRRRVGRPSSRAAAMRCWSGAPAFVPSRGLAELCNQRVVTRGVDESPLRQDSHAPLDRGCGGDRVVRAAAPGLAAGPGPRGAMSDCRLLGRARQRAYKF